MLNLNRVRGKQLPLIFFHHTSDMIKVIITTRDVFMAEVCSFFVDFKKIIHLITTKIVGNLTLDFQ